MARRGVLREPVLPEEAGSGTDAGHPQGGHPIFPVRRPAGVSGAVPPAWMVCRVASPVQRYAGNRDVHHGSRKACRVVLVGTFKRAQRCVP